MLPIGESTRRERFFASSLHRALFQAQGERIREHGDELGIRRLALYVRHGVAEKFLQDFNIAAIPCDLDGVANCALHPRGSGVEFLRNGGVKHLGDGIYDVHIIHRKHIASRKY